MTHATLAGIAAILLGTLLPTMAAAQTDCPAVLTQPSPIETWREKPGHHPLVGTVLQRAEPPTSGAEPCSYESIEVLAHTLTARVAGGGFVLLGEVHDNGAQHALHGYLLSAIAAGLARQGRRPPALVFEHIRVDQAAALAAPLEPTPEGARELLERLDWKNSGWPASTLFLPIFEAAAAHALPIVPGHPTRAEVRDVARRGLEALPKETVARLGLDIPLPGPLADALLDELEDSHCGLVPRAAFTNMALAQRYRDAHMSAAMLSAASVHGAAILLAGNGHVRSDRGVPRDLARLAPGRPSLAVALIEVEDGKNERAAYWLRNPLGKPTADFVVLTPRTPRADPCEAMRAQFKKR
jgi:uncharacterized iron-regulated protein